MPASKSPQEPNTLFIEVSGAGLPEVDGLFVPSTAPPAESESGVVSSLGYWNGKMAWDRADGKCSRSPALSYSNSYTSWRICRLDGHLAYDITTEDALPPTDREWHVYKKGVAPAPTVTIHHFDPRLPCPTPNVVFVVGGPGSGKGTICEVAESQLGWTHLSIGELLRAKGEAGGPKGEALDASLAAGNLSPNETVAAVLGEAMERITRTTGRNNFLIDGFPRSLENLEVWYELAGQDAKLPKMLYFECPYPILEQRILSRAKYSGRSDDNIEAVKQRFDIFKAETLPTVEFFKDRDLCVEVDTSQKRKLVYDQVASHLREFTDESIAMKPLTERAEILLGLRPWPKETS